MIYSSSDSFGGILSGLWTKQEILLLSQQFAKMPALYIADGHHRSAAAALVGAEKANRIRTIMVTKSILFHGCVSCQSIDYH